MATDSLDPFGANEWLVDELYDLYQQDKSKVDPTWWEFFADYTPGSATRPAAQAVAAPPAAQPAPVTAPATDAAPVSATPVAAAAPAPTAPTAPTAPVAPKPAEAGAVVLKGPAARVVVNMEASLSVPTATSVRAVPARLLEDNRTVINNHLARTRGGKVSFTHLIGFAVVQAAHGDPEMNGHFTEVDGKPALVATDQVNLGLAIDLAKPDGTRQLLVPGVEGAQEMDFSQFLAAYEDVVRKARKTTS